MIYFALFFILPACVWAANVVRHARLHDAYLRDLRISAERKKQQDTFDP